MLATGTLQYFEKQGVPSRSVNTSNGQATLTVKGGGAARSWFRAPWAGCGGAYEWQIHLNPTVWSDITAHTGGGNVKLNLTGLAVTRLSADSGGGNMDVVLPDNAADLSATAKTGAGNVTVEFGTGITGRNTINANSGAGNVVVRIPSGVAAKIHATSGAGKVIVDPRFSKIDGNTYQSLDYEGADNKVEITLHSGAGSVNVNSKQNSDCGLSGMIMDVLHEAHMLGNELASVVRPGGIVMIPFWSSQMLVPGHPVSEERLNA